MDTIKQLKQTKKELLAKYGQRSDLKATWQTLNTLIPYFVLFYLALTNLTHSFLIFTLSSALLILILMRVFMMMHDCGHQSLFKTNRYNRWVGFIMGVLCGIPEYVWSKHHAYHHATNGNWDKYQGPLNILSTEQFADLTPAQQKSYAANRNIWKAPLGGIMYFIINPRWTWIKGTTQFIQFFIQQKRQHNASNEDIAKDFKTGYWANWKEYRHMAANNIALFILWGLAGSYFGWWQFALVYTLVIGLSGALGIILFSVQHNFEDSYTSGDEGWDYDQASIEGTSYLDLPQILHWFTASIGYHHVHHLHSRIPNYNLAACHHENAHLFTDVPRIRLSQVRHAFEYILWDRASKQMMSVAEFHEQYTSNKTNSMESSSQ